MKFSIDIKPLSVNRAWQGRRFSTPAKKQYENALSLMLPKSVEPGPYYRVDYKFHLVNFALTDAQNLLKPFTDCIVKRGIIRDDRYIIDERIRKFRSETDRIEIEIESIRSEHGNN